MTTQAQIPYDQNLWTELCGRKVTATNTMFLVANDNEVDKLTEFLAVRKGIPLHPRGKMYPVRDVISSGHRVRLERWERYSFQKKLERLSSASEVLVPKGGGESQQSFMSYNIGQNPSFHQQCSQLVPRPLTGSHNLVWSEARQGLLTPLELWCTQGHQAMRASAHHTCAQCESHLLMRSVHILSSVVPVACVILGVGCRMVKIVFRCVWLQLSSSRSCHVQRIIVIREIVSMHHLS